MIARAPDWQRDGVKLYCGDCLDVLPQLEAEFSACVCDPPYGLEFMGKEWDRLEGYIADTGFKGMRLPRQRKRNVRCPDCGKLVYDKPPRNCTCGGVRRLQQSSMQLWHQQWAEAVLRVLKPGAPLLAFGGTRTFHRLICAVEDAGFEIRDCLMWVYGSGFPKSLDISKAIDKAAGAEREVVGYSQSFQADYHVEQGYRPHPYTSTHLSNTPLTEAAELWDGYGTSLKPAWEPITLAMKPLDGTFAHNALEHGVAGINVDGCRVGTEGGSSRSSGMNRYNAQLAEQGYRPNRYEKGAPSPPEPAGRWPANLIHDGSEEVVGLFPEQSGGGTPKRRFSDKTCNSYGRFHGHDCPPGIGPTHGSAARFFYCAKASKKDRTCNGKVVNKHPTVKPRLLMEWLCRLVTPPRNGAILDPFMGSGSTAIGAILAGSRFVGIEKAPESFQIAVKRIEAEMDERRQRHPLFDMVEA